MPAGAPVKGAATKTPTLRSPPLQRGMKVYFPLLLLSGDTIPIQKPESGHVPRRKKAPPLFGRGETGNDKTKSIISPSEKEDKGLFLTFSARRPVEARRPSSFHHAG